MNGRDGRVTTFGTPGHAADDPATLTDPARADHVFCWKLTETRDTFGNRIVFEYQRDEADLPVPGVPGAHRRWVQLYLKHIFYVDIDRDAPPPFMVSSTFDYDARPDPFSHYRSGFGKRR